MFICLIDRPYSKLPYEITGIEGIRFVLFSGSTPKMKESGGNFNGANRNENKNVVFIRPKQAISLALRWMRSTSFI